MAVNAQKVLEVAREELGYNEKLTPENLDMKVAPNDGAGNYTKYARDLYKAGFFNGDKQGHDYCAVGVTWVFWVACNKDRNRALFMLCQYGLEGAGCTQAMGYYKTKKRLYDTPKVGDQAFFSETQKEEPSNADHTELVEQVEGNKVTCISFNSSQGVRRLVHYLNDGWLYCFGRPIYDEEEPDAPEPTKEPVKQEDTTSPVDVYVVKQDDTLGEIAEAYRVSTDDLAAWNNIQNKDLIYVGQILKVVKPANKVIIPSVPISVGDRVLLDEEATVFASEERFLPFVYSSVLYVRQLDGSRAVISTLPSGDITGAVDVKYLRKV